MIRRDSSNLTLWAAAGSSRLISLSLVAKSSARALADMSAKGSAFTANWLSRTQATNSPMRAKASSANSGRRIVGLSTGSLRAIAYS